MKRLKINDDDEDDTLARAAAESVFEQFANSEQTAARAVQLISQSPLLMSRLASDERFLTSLEYTNGGFNAQVLLPFDQIEMIFDFKTLDVAVFTPARRVLARHLPAWLFDGLSDVLKTNNERECGMVDRPSLKLGHDNTLYMTLRSGAELLQHLDPAVIRPGLESIQSDASAEAHAFFIDAPTFSRKKQIVHQPGSWLSVRPKLSVVFVM